MRFPPRCIALLSVFALTASATLAQTPATPPTQPQAAPIKHPVPVKHLAPVHKPTIKPAKHPLKPSLRPTPPAALGKGAWMNINAHMLGTIGESTWVNLAQASSIRFYQSGKTPFAAVGTGGSNFVSTSDPAEIQKLRAYVLSHQNR